MRNGLLAAMAFGRFLVWSLDEDEFVPLKPEGTELHLVNRNMAAVRKGAIRSSQYEYCCMQLRLVQWGQ